MKQYIRYLCSINLINLANHVVGKRLITVGDTNYESEFEQLFKWRPFRNGFEEARDRKKPILLLIHKVQCPACIKLKQRCSKSVRLMDLSDRFIMIKVDMESNPTILNEKYQPDGKYVPRILFFTSKGDFIKEAYNKHTDADKEHKYFYKTPSQLVETMMYVLKKYTNEPLSVQFLHEETSKLEKWDLDDDTLGPTLLP